MSFPENRPVRRRTSPDTPRIILLLVAVSLALISDQVLTGSEWTMTVVATGAGMLGWRP